jgi:uncharacterized lipoprotein YajG
MVRQTLLLVLCAVLLFAACVKPIYVRPFEPSTRSDSMAIRADSMAWAAQEQQRRTQAALIGAITSLVMFLVVLPALYAL